MYRKANEPFTWHPVYADSDIVSHYARIGGVYQIFETAEQRAAYCKRKSAGFYEMGITLVPGAEPTHWTLDPAFEIDARIDPRTGRCALKVAA